MGSRHPCAACTAGSLGGQEISPKPDLILQVLKPSKLASLSVSVFNMAVLSIQSPAISYISKLTIDTRWKKIVVMQSLIRRWALFEILLDCKDNGADFPRGHNMTYGDSRLEIS